MATYQVDILNPKALKLLQELESQHLISMSAKLENSFLQIADKLRKKAERNPPSLDEITKEVETVRANRYARDQA